MQPPTFGEIVFVVAMLLLTVLVTAACIFFFMRQYRKEMREKEKDRE